MENRDTEKMERYVARHRQARRRHGTVWLLSVLTAVVVFLSLTLPAFSQTDMIDLAAVRQAIRKERKIDIGYRDKDGSLTERRVWPFALGFFERARLVVGWCELRSDFRMFRVDRIERLNVTDIRSPRRRLDMLKAWKESEGRPPDA